MIKIEEAKHWNFAYRYARNRLESLVWGFDFDKESDGHNYVGLQEPQEFIEIIDGLLNGIEDLYQGDIATLKKIRQRFEIKIAPIYELGHQPAHQLWSEASTKEIQTYMNTSTPDMKRKAKESVGSKLSMSEQSWFIEGFCRQWQHEYTEHVRNNIEGKEQNND